MHGGYIAAAFDEVLGSTQSLSGSPGMTGRLTVHYRKPTPLQTELQFEGWIESVEGRKIFTKGELRAGDLLCAEAEGLFISMKTDQFVGDAGRARSTSGRLDLNHWRSRTNASTTGTSSTRCSFRPETIAPSTAPATSSAFTRTSPSPRRRQPLSTGSNR